MKHKNLWAPWRMEYIQALKEDDECFICHDVENPQDDDSNLVLWRTEHCIVVMNRFPYNNGHLMVVPIKHVSNLSQLNKLEIDDLFETVQHKQKY